MGAAHAGEPGPRRRPSTPSDAASGREQGHGRAGCVLCALGDADGARAAFQAALRLAPQHLEARRRPLPGLG